MKKKHNIEDETPLLPWILAESVCTEVYQITASDKLVKALQPYLIDKTNTIYENNAHFRNSMMKDEGREKLMAFMRHWSAGFLLKDGVPRSAIPIRWANGTPLSAFKAPKRPIS